MNSDDVSYFKTKYDDLMKYVKSGSIVLYDNGNEVQRRRLTAYNSQKWFDLKDDITPDSERVYPLTGDN
jgi:hypothetical protein